MSKTAILAVRIVGDAKQGKKALDDTGASADGLFAKIKTGTAAAVGIGVAVATGVYKAGSALYDMGAEWQDVENTLRVGTGAVGDDLDGLVDSVKTVGSQIPAEFGDVATTLGDLNTQLGLTGDNLETVTTQILEAGRILGTSVDTQKMSQSFQAFNLEAGDMEHAMDDLFRVSQATGIGMNELAGEVRAAAPTADILGLSFQDTAAMIGSFDKAGLNSGKMMQSMGRGLTNLAKSGEEPADAFHRVIGEIEGFTAAGDTAAALDLAGTLFGTRNAPEFVKAIQDGTFATEDMMNAIGATGDTILGLGQETMTAAEKWDVLKNRAMVALEPLASAVFDGVGQALDWIINLIDGINFSAATEWTAGFGQAWEAIEPIFSQVYDIILLVVDQIQTNLAAFLEWGQAAWAAWGDDIVAVGQAAWDFLVEGIIKPALDVIAAVIETVTAVINGDWEAAWEGVKNVASRVWDMISGIIDRGTQFIRTVIDTAVTIISDLWSGLWTGVQTALSTAWDHIKSGVKSGIDDTVQWFRDLPGKILDSLSSMPRLLLQMGKDMLGGLLNGIKSQAAAVVDAVVAPVKNGWNAAKSFLGISSPSRLMKQMGSFTGAGYVDGVRSQTTAVMRAGTELVRAVVPKQLPAIPHARGRAGGSPINIEIKGALDPLAVGRQIDQIMRRYHGTITGGVTG